MPNTKLTLIKKCHIAEEANIAEKLRKTAHNHNKNLSRISQWRKNYGNIKASADNCPKKLTLHSGSTFVYKDVEEQVYEWLITQREAENCVSTKNIVDHAVSICLSFKAGVECKTSRWAYDLKQRHHLYIRTSTRIAQVTDAVNLILGGHTAVLQLYDVDFWYSR